MTGSVRQTFSSFSFISKALFLLTPVGHILVYRITAGTQKHWILSLNSCRCCFCFWSHFVPSCSLFNMRYTVLLLLISSYLAMCDYGSPYALSGLVTNTIRTFRCSDSTNQRRFHALKNQTCFEVGAMWRLVSSYVL